MLEKSFKNEELGIEMNSFIDNKQNIWFRGKDVTKILGYRDTDQAIRKNVSTENKCFILFALNVPPSQRRVNKMTPEENIVPPSQRHLNKMVLGDIKHPPNKITPEAQIVGVAKRHLNKMAPGALKQGVNKMTLEENIVHLLMSLVFMSLYLVLN